MVSLRKMSAGTTYIKSKRVSKWEDVMKNFTEKHKEKCITVPLEVLRLPRSVKRFPTGSEYDGSWDVLGMCGFGNYTFPNGVVYEGDFEDGMMHGKGELKYNGDDGEVIRGTWKKGVMTERTLLFSDTLEYSEDFWKYCMMPDRRFAIEYDIDLMPAGKSFLTADQPTKEIPPGFYDTGDGFYDPNTKIIYNYDDPTAITRSPSISEQKWILDNCRMCPEVPLGPRPDLYENWSEPTVHLTKQPPPAAGVKQSHVTMFRKQSLYEQEFDFLDEKRENFYDSTRKVSTEGRPFRRFRLAATE